MFQGECTYFINFPFNCDSSGVVYILSCKTCQKIYVGSTIASFRKQFNNYNSSATRYSNGQRGMVGEQLYTHFFEPGHNGVNDMCIKIIDKMDINEPSRREGFWAYKLNLFTPQELNQRNFFIRFGDNLEHIIYINLIDCLYKLFEFGIPMTLKKGVGP